jgi:hypothetical protein
LTDPGALPSRLGLPPKPVRLLLGGLVTLAVLLVAVALSNLEQPVACACTPSASTPDLPPSPVVGVVVAIDQVSLTQVNSFDLRMTDGKTVRLKVGALDNATQFSLSHLATHMATGVPIRAFYRLENSEPVAYHLEDAVPATASPAAT